MAAAVLAGAGVAFAATPAAAQKAPLPQRGPAASPEVRNLINQLGDRDANRREQARIALMGLRRDQLDGLRDTVRRLPELTPEQAEGLRDVVVHVYIAGAPLDRAPNGFLGVRLPVDTFDPVGPFNPNPNPDGGGEPDEGALVVARIPGFAAYRYLRDGDVIVGIDGRPAGPIRTPGELKAAVTQIDPGTAVRLLVRRGGAIETVPIVIDSRPVIGDPLETDDIIGQLAREADDYFDRQFGPLLHGQAKAE